MLIQTIWKRFKFNYQLLRAPSEIPQLGRNGVIRAALKSIQGAMGGKVYLSPKKLFYP